MTDNPLLEPLLSGNVAAIARAVSIVENARPGFESLLGEIHDRLGRSRRIGITGPPGAGKSTLTMHLVGAWRAAGLKVAVIAVDPTSPFTGGALLGDRIRMEEVALDPGVYIRSMATRGSLGGIANTTREVCDLLDAAGFDRIVVETVGVGQSELDVAGITDSTVLALVPESGDGIQALKSGVMEVADVFVVNKADRSGAPKLCREVELALDLRMGKSQRNIPAHHGGLKASGTTAEDTEGEVEWRPPVLQTVAVKGEGVDQLTSALDTHWEFTVANGSLAERRTQRMVVATKMVVERAVARWLFSVEGPASTLLEGRIREVVSGDTSPYQVASDVVGALKQGVGV